jgi:hypothetical protein
MSEARFQVLEPLLCNGVFYAVGTEALLPADIAAPLIATGVVVALQAAPKRRKEGAKEAAKD